MKTGLGGFAALAAALVCAVGMAGATALPRDGKIAADCSGFTVTFYGSNFDPPPSSASSATVGYTVTLTTGSGSFPYTGSAVMSYGDSVDPLWSTTPDRPSVAIKVPWGREVCGSNTIVSGGADPDGMYFNGARVGAFAFNWSARYPNYNDNSGAVAAVTTSTLVCTCSKAEICRTPGFWGTHAGTAKAGSSNITQAVLNKVASAQICGKSIFNTTVASANSALEAMCVSPKGDQRLQLARQLTSAALNCIMSGGGATCTGVSIQSTFAACNDTCSGLPSSMSTADCIDAIDCFNNGGTLLDNGVCQMGTCNGDGTTGCETDDNCAHLSSTGSPAVCIPPAGNCHDRALVNDALGLSFDPPGPAGSTDSCNTAHKNKCNIFGGC